MAKRIGAAIQHRRKLIDWLLEEDGQASELLDSSSVQSSLPRLFHESGVQLNCGRD